MFKKIINKGLSLLVRLRYGKLPANLFYYYRDTYYCQLVQLKYLFKDYVIKKKYKSLYFHGEFAPELQFALPFAYWHYKNGTLKSTHASKLTKELYFFSPHHEEIFTERNNEGNYNYEMPRILYSQNYDMKKWAPVPLKETYKNQVYIFEKPMLIIANRYNMEWDGPPISFFSIEILDEIINELKDKYTIVYNRPRPQNITMDDSDIYELNDYEWLAGAHPEVVLMEDLYQENKGKGNNYNHFQLMVYANADRFLSIHGGTATLASYFGGINIVLSKQGPEHHFKCYEKLYPMFSGAKVLHAKTNEAVLSYIKEYYS
jgi:hypothetical protein